MIKILSSEITAEAEFRRFWDAAVAYQRRRQLPRWSAYPQALIAAEIAAGLHFSGMAADGGLLGFFSVLLSDPLIWRQQEQGDAIYLHRMCINPACKGLRFAAVVLDWAKTHAAGLGRRRVRMDTWEDNPRLIDYYLSCGYRLAGQRLINGAEPGLPPHYRNARLVLFENAV